MTMRSHSLHCRVLQLLAVVPLVLLLLPSSAPPLCCGAAFAASDSVAVSAVSSGWQLDWVQTRLQPHLFSALVQPSTAELELLYLLLPASNASSTLYSLSPSNPSFVPTDWSSPPDSPLAFLLLFSSATNSSDPLYLNNTVMAAGALAAVQLTTDESASPSVSPTPSPLLLTADVPGSAIFTVYYLLVNASTGETSAVLQSANSSNVTMAAMCVIPPALTFCQALPSVITVSSALNPFDVDDVAAAAYAADLSLFSFSTACATQQPNVSICADCLAIRQRWRCAQEFGGCLDEPGDGGVSQQTAGQLGPCQWLCEEKNSRCSELEDCTVYPTINCNAANSRYGPADSCCTLLLLMLLLHVIAALTMV